MTTRQTAGARKGTLALSGLGSAGDYGALGPYADAALYDRTYARRRLDVDWYVKLCGRRGATVLEYGAGSGRITLPLARAGARVAAIDASAPMLERLREKLSREAPSVRQRVELVHADMRLFRASGRYSWVIAPFNTVLHLYEPEELSAFLHRVREHMRPRGRFAFDFSVPSPGDLVRNPERSLAAGQVRHPVTRERLRCRERFEYDPLRQLLVVWTEYWPERGAPWVVPLAHRQYFPLEMEALLAHHGLRVERRDGDFTGCPPSLEVDSLALVLRHAGRASPVPGR